MRALWIGLLFLLINTAYAAQTVYQWTDDQGNTVFSDKPQHPDAKQIEVAPLPSFNPGTVVDKDAATPKDDKVQKVSYQTLAVMSPKNEENIWSNPGIILVSVDVKPELAKEDKIVVLIDGKATDSPANGTNFQVTNVERGTHTLQAQIRDSQGKVVKTSNSVTVYMHKASLNQPSRGEATPMIIQRSTA